MHVAYCPPPPLHLLQNVSLLGGAEVIHKIIYESALQVQKKDLDFKLEKLRNPEKDLCSY